MLDYPYIILFNVTINQEDSWLSAHYPSLCDDK
jgi:hypothetical protein